MKFMFAQVTAEVEQIQRQRKRNPGLGKFKPGPVRDRIEVVLFD
jgi:hypothetical protein